MKNTYSIGVLHYQKRPVPGSFLIQNERQSLIYIRPVEVNNIRRNYYLGRPL